MTRDEKTTAEIAEEILESHRRGMRDIAFGCLAGLPENEGVSAATLKAAFRYRGQAIARRCR